MCVVVDESHTVQLAGDLRTVGLTPIWWHGTSTWNHLEPNQESGAAPYRVSTENQGFPDLVENRFVERWTKCDRGVVAGEVEVPRRQPSSGLWRRHGWTVGGGSVVEAEADTT
jgi:hypothetical protein